MTRKSVLISIWAALCIFSGCVCKFEQNGKEYERDYLMANNLQHGNTEQLDLGLLLAEINCTDSTFVNKRLQTASQFHSADTNAIIVIPYSTTSPESYSEGFSDLGARSILLDFPRIKNFCSLSALSGTKSFEVIVKMIILHEIGHFMDGREGAFDHLSN